MKELDRVQKAYLYTLWRVQELVVKGYVKCDTNAPYLTPEGMNMVAKIIEDGFEPTKEELQLVTAFLRDPNTED